MTIDATGHVHATAAAKINLTLHVTGQRADGYHLLDSLVVFAGQCDHLIARASNQTQLSVVGKMAASVPTDPDNLVLRAAALMGVTAQIELQKHLPVAAGIGGGSADAAACLRALSELSGKPIPDDTLSLGADVPVCVGRRPARMRGIGEILDPIPDFPILDAVLVNPGVAVSTPHVFAAMGRAENPAMPLVLPHLPNARQAINWLGGMRNDMQMPAITLCSAIGQVLAALEGTNGIGLARMSGSGATCFGLYEDAQDAQKAADALAKMHPEWWVRATLLGPG